MQKVSKTILKKKKKKKKEAKGQWQIQNPIIQKLLKKKNNKHVNGSFGSCDFNIAIIVV